MNLFKKLLFPLLIFFLLSLGSLTLLPQNAHAASCEVKTPGVGIYTGGGFYCENAQQAALDVCNRMSGNCKITDVHGDPTTVGTQCASPTTQNGDFTGYAVSYRACQITVHVSAFSDKPSYNGHKDSGEGCSNLSFLWSKNVSGSTKQNKSVICLPLFPSTTTINSDQRGNVIWIPNANNNKISGYYYTDANHSNPTYVSTLNYSSGSTIDQLLTGDSSITFAVKSSPPTQTCAQQCSAAGYSCGRLSASCPSCGTCSNGTCSPANHVCVNNQPQQNTIKGYVFKDYNGDGKMNNIGGTDTCYTGTFDLTVEGSARNNHTAKTCGSGSDPYFILNENGNANTAYTVGLKKITGHASTKSYAIDEQHGTTGNSVRITGNAILSFGIEPGSNPPPSSDKCDSNSTCKNKNPNKPICKNPSFNNSVCVKCTQDSQCSSNQTCNSSNQCVTKNPPPTSNKCDTANLSKTAKNGNVYSISLNTNCAAGRNYTLSVKQKPSSDWTVTFSKTPVTTNSSGNAAFTVTIAAPANTTPGDHNVSIKADGPGTKTDDSLNLVYTVSNTCNRNPPGFSSAEPTKSGNAGDTLTYLVTLKNNNSSQCAQTDYKLSANATGNWTATFVRTDGTTIPNNILTHVPATGRSFKVKVKSPAGTANGNKTITLKAVDQTKNTNQKTYDLTYTVGSGGTCTAPNAQPHFECKSNACVSVATCGPNTGGCTAAGGTCGNPSNDTTLSFVIGLDDIGTTGDNVSNINTSSNKNPWNTQQTLTVDLFKATNTGTDPDAEETGTLTYDSTQANATYGKFTGSVDFGTDVEPGNYLVKVRVGGHLVRQIPGIQILHTGANPMAEVRLVAGDFNGDNSLLAVSQGPSIDDYSILISCSIFAKTDLAKTLCNSDPSYKPLADMNEDGTADNPKVDQLDYSYLIREFTVQSGN